MFDALAILWKHRDELSGTILDLIAKGKQHLREKMAGGKFD